MTVLSRIPPPNNFGAALYGLEKQIVSANVGAISTDDPLTDGYYMIQWDGAPYETEAAITTLQGTMPSTFVSKGEWLCAAFYWYKVPRTKHWYTSSRACVTV
jgi:hypothetical protein